MPAGTRSRLSIHAPSVASSSLGIANAETVNSIALTTTYEMGGLGLTYKVTKTGNVVIFVYGYVVFTAVSGATYTVGGVYYGTGNAPSPGGAAAGTQMNPHRVTTAVAGTSAGSEALTFPFSLSATVSGLSVGTTYWFDIQIKAGGSDSWTVGIGAVLIEG